MAAIPAAVAAILFLDHAVTALFLAQTVERATMTCNIESGCVAVLILPMDLSSSDLIGGGG
jgi:hypothetical protein